MGGQSHPIPHLGGSRPTGDRLAGIGLLIPDRDNRFFLNTPAFLRLRNYRRWRAAAGLVLLTAAWLLAERLAIT